MRLKTADIRLCAAFIVALLAGCAHFESQPLSPERVADSYVARNLNDEGLHTFFEARAPEIAAPWPRTSWDLPALTLAAFYFNPDLEVARAQWVTARASVESVRARPNPSLTLTPAYNFSATNGTSPWLPGISLDLPIETAGKRRIRTSKADNLAEVARLEFIGTAWHVRAELRSALIAHVAAKRRGDLLHEQLAIQGRIVELLTQRLTLGAASSADLAPARIALTRLQADNAQTEADSIEAAGALARVLGIPSAALADVRFDFSIDTSPSVETAQARTVALHNRADISAGLAEYAASESDLELEIAKQYPDIHLGPGYEWDQGESKWSLGLGFELPLNGNRPAIAEAKAKRDESAVRFRALEAGVISDIDRASATHLLAVRQLSELRKLHESLIDNSARQQARLAAGDIDQLEYQTAKLETSVASLALLESQTKAAQSAGAFEDVLQQPIAAIDALSADASHTGSP